MSRLTGAPDVMIASFDPDVLIGIKSLRQTNCDPDVLKGMLNAPLKKWKKWIHAEKPWSALE